MSDLKNKVDTARQQLTSLQETLKMLNTQGVSIELTIGTKAKTVTFTLPDSDIPVLDVELKATINQEL